MSEKTIFKRIIDKEIPAQIVYEDDRCLAFEDIHPRAPVHVLVIPKQEIATLSEAAEEDAPLLGHLLLVVARLAAKLGVTSGYRVVLNCGRGAGQEVMHLHVHLLAGGKMTFPPAV